MRVLRGVTGRSADRDVRSGAGLNGMSLPFQDFGRARLRRGGMVLAVALWVLLFGSPLKKNMELSSEPDIINEDAQTLWHFFPFRDTALFPNDYIRDYYLRVYYPLGYRLTFALLAPLVDPSVLSKMLPYLLLGVTVASVAIASLRLGGLTSFFAAGVLCLSSEVFLDRMAGGLPRAFGFPVLAFALLGLASGRVMFLVTAVLLGMAFYPWAAVAPGLALAFLLFIVPHQDRGSAREWSLRRRIFLLGSVTAVSVLLTLPMALGGRAFGSRIAPSRVGEYPEAGPGGRYGPNDRPPFEKFLPEAIRHTVEAFGRYGPDDRPPFAKYGTRWKLFGVGLAALMGSGLLLLSFRDAAGRRVLALAAAVVAGHTLARALAPYLYLPERQLIYPIPVLALCLVPTSAFVLGGFLGGRMRSIGRPAAALLVTGFCLAFFGAGVRAWTGLNIDVRHDKGVHSFLASLPKDVLVAGFPAPRGKIQEVPYFSRRRALIDFESHQAHHTGYVEEMRRRMRALIAAYFATEVAPITRLHDEFGVTHLIIDRADFGPKAPWYFEPFTPDIRRAHAAGREKGFAALKLADLTVFSERDIFILDLRRLRRSGPDS